MDLPIGRFFSPQLDYLLDSRKLQQKMGTNVCQYAKRGESEFPRTYHLELKDQRPDTGQLLESIVLISSAPFAGFYTNAATIPLRFFLKSHQR